ncbi:MAG TPA: helix-turn-helix domain-containing protein [Kofleriaceae bacterium]|nr:helix-turn-helix domain-containing protein [Kofleriaceae bacterium]
MAVETTLEDVVRRLVREAVRGELAAFAQLGGEPRNANDAYLSIAKAARVADVAPGTVRTWIRHGRLTSKRAGRVLRVSRSELERFMSGVPTGPRGTDIKERVARRLESDKQALRKRP